MKVLLPPSETKRDGGNRDAVLDWAQLSFSALTEQRSVLAAALIDLSQDADSARRALGISVKQQIEIERNRALKAAPVMTALERYTGVLYDGLDAPSLTAAERTFAQQSFVIHSALFGPIGAGDPIPAYRLSYNSKVPGFALKAHWRSAVSQTLSEINDFQLDLRSEAYAQLGAASGNSAYVRVVTEGTAGKRVALSHFNKKAKGLFSRALIRTGINHESTDSLIEWSNTAGFRLEPGAPGELDLIVQHP